MHRTSAELDAGLDRVRSSPRDRGRLEAIVIRPQHGERLEPNSVRLDLAEGAVGDVWVRRYPSPPQPGTPDQETQLNLANARAVDVVAGDRSRWALAGDQLYLDFDLSEDHLRPGDRVRIGNAVIEITPKAHNGCRKFADRFGEAALSWVNSPAGKQLHLRGICARVIEPGEIRVGDVVEKLSA